MRKMINLKQAHTWCQIADMYDCEWEQLRNEVGRYNKKLKGKSRPKQ